MVKLSQGKNIFMEVDANRSFISNKKNDKAINSYDIFCIDKMIYICNCAL